MRLSQLRRGGGPKEAVPFLPGSPAYEESVQRAKEAAQRERESAGIDVGPDGRVVVKVQTYQTEKFA